MVLTLGVDGDVLDDHHLVALLGTVFEHLEDVRGILAIPAAPVAPRFGHTARGLQQAAAFRVLADELEQALDVVLDPTLGGLLPREDHPAVTELPVLLGLVNQGEEGFARVLIAPTLHGVPGIDEVVDEQVRVGRVIHQLQVTVVGSDCEGCRNPTAGDGKDLGGLRQQEADAVGGGKGQEGDHLVGQDMLRHMFRLHKMRSTSWSPRP